jgi:hypothetical protein
MDSQRENIKDDLRADVARRGQPGCHNGPGQYRCPWRTGTLMRHADELTPSNSVRPLTVRMVLPTLTALLVPATCFSHLTSSSHPRAEMRTIALPAIAGAAQREFDSALSASTNPKRLHPPSEAQTRQRTSVTASSPTRQQHPLGRFRLPPGRPSHLARSLAEDGKLARKQTAPTHANTDGRTERSRQVPRSPRLLSRAFRRSFPYLGDSHHHGCVLFTSSSSLSRRALS